MVAELFIRFVNFYLLEEDAFGSAVIRRCRVASPVWPAVVDGVTKKIIIIIIIIIKYKGIRFF